MQRDIMFLDTLVYYLVTEELDGFVVGWVKAELPRDVSSMFPRDKSDRWRGQLLRALIGAHLDLAFQNSADRALQALFAVCDDVMEARKASAQLKYTPLQGFSYTALWPAVVRADSTLSQGDLGATDARRFERFLDLVASLEKKYPESAVTRVAHLRIHHPTKPDPDPFLAFLRGHFGDRCWAEISLPASFAGATAQVRPLLAMETIIRMLGAQGRQADADWVANGRDRLLAGAAASTRRLF